MLSGSSLEGGSRLNRGRRMSTPLQITKTAFGMFPTEEVSTTDSAKCGKEVVEDDEIEVTIKEPLSSTMSSYDSVSLREEGLTVAPTKRSASGAKEKDKQRWAFRRVLHWLAKRWRKFFGKAQK